MKNSFYFFIALFGVITYIACEPGTKAADDNGMKDDTTHLAGTATMSSADSVKRGEYILSVTGCTDCHTPKMMTDKGPVPNPDLLLSGHPASEKLPPVSKDALASGWILFNMGITAYVGPWGTSYAANLTPDETGLGNWSYENFRKAIREGKFKGMDGGRMLLPPMPWMEIAKLTDEDLQSMWAYLKTIKPVSNVVPAAVPPAM